MLSVTLWLTDLFRMMSKRVTSFWAFLLSAFRINLPGFRLFDAGAAILFFGALSQQTPLHQAASQALQELAAQGYQIPNENQPVKVFPALTSGQFSGYHAGGWRPGVIYLRQHPQGGLAESIYLRHELFHEANHLSCNGRLPAWAEEAGAMHFSGELTGQNIGTWPSAAELEELNSHIRQGGPLENNDRALLARLVGNAGWPDTPCAMSPKLRELLGSAFDEAGASAYLLMNLQSGRILASGGDQRSRLPPGSLLKLVYAASLSPANPQVLSAELAASDTDKLLRRRRQFDPARYRLLLSPIGDKRLLQAMGSAEADWQVYLGGRDSDGNFPLDASLPELALAMRSALLYRPDYFKGLTRNGTLPQSTLFGQSEADKKQLRQMQVLAKTGTVSNANGQPLAGHLLLAWPAEHPVFLAIFRQKGRSGAAILPKASAFLRQWQKTYPPRFATVRVHLLSLTSHDSWEAQADCPEVTVPPRRFTVCGQFHIVSSARGSRSERIVHGVLHEAGQHGPVVLETDIASYVDAVLAAEAQALSNSARQAMRAVIVWNASHGRHRHPESSSLCDTTHCMVFLGERPVDQTKRSEAIDIDLLELLDTLAAEAKLNWLPFAAGGEERWRRQMSISELNNMFNEEQIADIRRERRKNGELFIHLYYPDSEEIISCEIFRNALKLPSCPDLVTAAINHEQLWEFQGLGAGHGLGLSVARAQALAVSGYSAEQILIDAYKSLATNAQ